MVVLEGRQFNKYEEMQQAVLENFTSKKKIFFPSIKALFRHCENCVDIKGALCLMTDNISICNTLML